MSVGLWCHHLACVQYRVSHTLQTASHCICVLLYLLLPCCTRRGMIVAEILRASNLRQELISCEVLEPSDWVAWLQSISLNRFLVCQKYFIWMLMWLLELSSLVLVKKLFLFGTYLQHYTEKKSQWYNHGDSPVIPRECLNLLWPLYLRFEVLSFRPRWDFRSSRYAWSLSGIFSSLEISTRHLCHGPCSLYNETQNNGINLFHAPDCLPSQAKSHSPNSFLFNDRPNARKGLLLILGY